MQEKKMRTQTEIAEKIERLNTLAKNLNDEHAQTNVGILIAHLHTLSSLFWVLGEVPDIAIERLLEDELKYAIERQKKPT